MLWPFERGGRVAETRVEDHFAAIRTELGLPPELTFHPLRRSYVTHVIEDGFDTLTAGTGPCPGSRGGSRNASSA